MSSSGQKRTRRKDIPDWVSQIDGWLSRKITWTNGKPVYDNFVGSHANIGRGSSPRGFQVMEDENHIADMGHYERVAFQGDVGGDMRLYRQAVTCDSHRHHLSKLTPVIGGVQAKYDIFTPLLAIDPTNAIVQIPPLTERDLGPVGTEAFNRCKPTNRPVSLAVDLAELRSEGLPALLGVNLWKEKTNLARGAGAEYLNSEFGWKPLTGDIRSACYAAANAHKILKSYERGSGQRTRRRYEFPVEKSELWSTVGVNGTWDGYIPGNPTNIGNVQDSLPPGGSITKCRRFYRRTWFSGAFTYHLPLGFHSRNELIKAASQAGPLLGIELTPEVVWNATPWTWALNWFSNVGEVVSNVSDMSSDGLVMEYGYIMEHTVCSDTYYFGGPDGWLPADPFRRPDSVTAYWELKRRKRATPFGFELNWSQFTPRQLAITAALGLTRWF